jgi:CheY-like chemotaxis protein
VRHRPDIRCLPSADRAFARDVVALVDALPPDMPLDPEAVEQVVRTKYPEAVVRAADPLASLDGRAMWYVYRRSPMADIVAAQAEPSGTDRPTTEVYGDVPVYAPTVVAPMLGVPLAVLVGWDERDGLVRPTLSGGRRLYSRNQVDELRRLKREITAGRPADALAGVLDDHRANRRGGSRSRPKPRRQVAVLVAERDPFAAEFVEYLLRTEGYDVHVAYGTAEAEVQLGGERPDLAIVETLLPDGGALELCARLAAKGVPVIAIASVDGESDALGAGASAFLPKPLQPLRLLSAVRDLLGDSAFARDVPRDPR